MGILLCLVDILFPPTTETAPGAATSVLTFISTAVSSYCISTLKYMNSININSMLIVVSHESEKM